MPIIGNFSSAGKKPTTPTIGTATDGGTGTTASVAFTPSTYIGKSTITYTALSSPGSITATGAGSPITVSGLTTGTAYTFTVAGTTAYGVASDSSAASNSVTPASPSSFESIATITGTGSSSTLTFSSIPSGYKSLQIRGIANCGTSQNTLTLRINGDTGNSYSWHILIGQFNTVAAAGGANSSSVQNMLQLPGVASTYTASIIDIIDYTSTSKYKTIRNFAGTNSNDLGNEWLGITSGLWMSTSAVTSVSIVQPNGNNFTTASTFALYGIK
jgi:hypothetical protein